LSAAFNTYETQSALRIDQLAAANGADISGYRMNRARIQADIEQAKQNGDRVGQFKAEALLAGNNVFGLVKAGGDQDEIDEANQKAAELRVAYLKEVGIEAKNAGIAQGLTGDALKTHVDQAPQTAARELDDLNAQNAERAGLSTEQIAAAGIAVNAAATARLEEKKALVSVNGQTEDFSIQSPASQSTLAVDREEVASAKADMKSILAANGIAPPSVSTGFESCDVEASTPKHPAAAPGRSTPAQDGACIQ
jgi:rRNA maturation endonuclease Nob1